MEGEEGDVGSGAGQIGVPGLGLIAAVTPQVESPKPEIQNPNYDIASLRVAELVFGPRARLRGDLQIPIGLVFQVTHALTAEEAFGLGQPGLAHAIATAEAQELAMQSLKAFGAGPSATGYTGAPAVDAQGRLAFNDFGPGTGPGTGQGGAAPSAGTSTGAPGPEAP
jgi:hypothetical protein